MYTQSAIANRPPSHRRTVHRPPSRLERRQPTRSVFKPTFPGALRQAICHLPFAISAFRLPSSPREKQVKTGETTFIGLIDENYQTNPNSKFNNSFNGKALHLIME
jgi:hypothetical protein